MEDIYAVISLTMGELHEENPAAFQAALAHARGEPMDPGAVPALEELNILEHGGMHDLTAEVIRFLYPRSLYPTF